MTHLASGNVWTPGGTHGPVIREAVGLHPCIRAGVRAPSASAVHNVLTVFIDSALGAEQSLGPDLLAVVEDELSRRGTGDPS